MKHCKNCNLDYGDEFSFCRRCGNELEYIENIIICPNCRKKLEKTFEFCPFCGSRITGEKLSTKIQTNAGNTVASKEGLVDRLHQNTKMLAILVIFFIGIAIAGLNSMHSPNSDWIYLYESSDGEKVYFNKTLTMMDIDPNTNIVLNVGTFLRYEPSLKTKILSPFSYQYRKVSVQYDYNKPNRVRYLKDGYFDSNDKMVKDLIGTEQFKWTTTQTTEWQKLLSDYISKHRKGQRMKLS
jgi:hypothetical protein